MRIGALLGIGLAYAGSRRDDISALLTPFIADTSATADMEIVSMAGLALGLVHTGSANADAAAVIVERLMDASPAELNNPLSLQLGLGLGLLFLGRTEAVVAVDASLDTVDHPCAKTLKVLMNSLAYAGTGNVLKVQEMLHVCAEHPEGDEEKKKEQAEAEAKEAAEKKEAETGDKEKDDSAPTDSKFMYQSMAVLGLSLVVMGEDLGSDMLTRTTEHLLAYGDPAVRRAVPLALALCHVSSADYGIIDTLSKLSHDTDEITAVSAILALGLVTAGTNNSRAAGLLRSLSVFYEKQPHALFTTRLAQGLLHMGKGLMSLNPFHSEGLLMSPQGIGGLMVILTAFLNPRATILGTHHYLMYAVSIALRPRCLMMISDEGEDVHVDVRVGDALDLVGTAGSGKRTVSGFQTHSSPVLLNAKQRAELASEDYEALSQTLEGVVVVRRKAKEDESSGAGAGAAASS